MSRYTPPPLPSRRKPFVASRAPAPNQVPGIGGTRQARRRRPSIECLEVRLVLSTVEAISASNPLRYIDTTSGSLGTAGSISNDGRYMVLTSSAGNLTPGDENILQ